MKGSTPRITLYGIPNCDQVKKARDWFASHGIHAQFHDFKKAGVTPELIAGWLTKLDRDTLLNRRGTTWRGLPVQDQAAVIDDASAIACMTRSPSVIKRPVLELRAADSDAVTAVTAGFSDQLYRDLMCAHGLITQ